MMLLWSWQDPTLHDAVTDITTAYSNWCYGHDDSWLYIMLLWTWQQCTLHNAWESEHIAPIREANNFTMNGLKIIELWIFRNRLLYIEIHEHLKQTCARDRYKYLNIGFCTIPSSVILYRMWICSKRLIHISPSRVKF